MKRHVRKNATQKRVIVGTDFFRTSCGVVRTAICGAASSPRH